MPLAPGTRFGPYEVLGPLGAGGMGEVYRARDTRLSRDAALKVLPADGQFDETRRARFEREARTLATLSHANIATLFGLEEANGTQALAMELVDGQPLSDHLSRPDRQGGFGLTEVLAIARQIAVALDAAHEHGVVHRDLKPANVMVRPDGSVKVLDFGLAIAPPTSNGDERASSTITGVGTVVGTPAYMSPEQSRGYSVDRRTDIWAFGCVLYELLTGRRAFEGPTSSDVTAAVLERDPEWTLIPASTPDSLRRLLARCLVKDPRRRLRDIGDALIELDDIAAGAHGEGARPSAPDRSLRIWRAAAVVCAAALAAGLAWEMRRPEPRGSTPGQFALGFPREAPLRTGGAESGDVAISSDGARMAYPTIRGLAVRTRDRLDVVVIDLPDNPTHPFFSPDGAWIGYTVSSALRKVAVAGGPSILVAPANNAAIGSWGPDGIVYTDARGMFRVRKDGGQPEPVALGLGAGEQATFPEVLPGGRAVLFTVVPGRSNTPETIAAASTARIDAFDFTTGTRKTIARGGGHSTYVKTGHLVYAADASLRAVTFDPMTLVTQGTAVDVTSGPGISYAVAPDDGTLIYVASALAGASTLVWVDRAGREEPLGTPPMRYIYPRLSPDGRRVALDVGGSNRDIYVWDVSRRLLERLTTDQSEDAVVRWSPDGSRVLFASSRSGVPNIYSQALDGSGQAERVFESSHLNQPLAFAPNNQLIVAEVVPGRGRGIGVLSLPHPQHVQTLVENASNGELSPDGRWLAYGSTDSGQFEVYVTSFPDARGRWRISTDGGRQPAWARNGRELFYRDFNGALVAVPVTLSPAFSAGAAHRLFENAAYRGAGAALSDRTYDVSPDGKRFLMIRDADVSPPTLALVQDWTADVARRVPAK